MATNQESNPSPRKPRGAHVEETELMKALEADPAAAMQALSDEMVNDWEENAPSGWEKLPEAKTEE